MTWTCHYCDRKFEDDRFAREGDHAEHRYCGLCGGPKGVDEIPIVDTDDYEMPEFDELESAVPVEELRELVETWRERKSEVEGFPGEELTYKECADNLEELIDGE